MGEHPYNATYARVLVLRSRPMAASHGTLCVQRMVVTLILNSKAYGAAQTPVYDSPDEYWVRRTCAFAGKSSGLTLSHGKWNSYLQIYDACLHRPKVHLLFSDQFPCTLGMNTFFFCSYLARFMWLPRGIFPEEYKFLKMEF